ncbi:hypothetical protein B6U81_00525 [Thermoplasmatales archaeon ex4484_30]|nr:MAG: hypothetical protein B6U81_00525 [Thermoplasmatales archaeon ex4484_30]
MHAPMDEKMVVEDENLAVINIFKEGSEFVAIVETQGWKREYRNTVFEDMLRELVIDLQEEFGAE